MDTNDYIQFVFVLIVLLISIIFIILILIIVKCVQICVHSRILCCKRSRRRNRQSNGAAGSFDCFSNELSSDSCSSSNEDNEFSSSNSEILNYISNNRTNHFDNLAYSFEVDSSKCDKINRKYHDRSRFFNSNKLNGTENINSNIILNPSSLFSYLDANSTTFKDYSYLKNQQGNENLCFGIKEINKEKTDSDNDEIPPSYDLVFGRKTI